MALQHHPPAGTDAPRPVTAGIVPIPDPTVLTNQLVSSAIQAMREVLETKIKDIDNRINKLEPAMLARIEEKYASLKELKDHDVVALHAEVAFFKELKKHDLDAMTDRANTITATITRFYDEKFRTLDAQTSKAAVDVKTAMDAAFVAAAASPSIPEPAPRRPARPSRDEHGQPRRRARQSRL